MVQRRKLVACIAHKTCIRRVRQGRPGTRERKRGNKESHYVPPHNVAPGLRRLLCTLDTHSSHRNKRNYVQSFAEICKYHQRVLVFPKKRPARGMEGF